MRLRAFLIPVLAAAAALPACTPRQPPPAPPPVAPPPAPAPSPEDVDRAREGEARRYWDEATRLGRQGRWPEAERQLREAVRLQPLSATFHMALSTALLNQGKTSEAADALWAGIRAEEAQPRPNHRVLAVDYERLIELLDRVGRSGEAGQARQRQAEHRRRRDAQVP